MIRLAKSPAKAFARKAAAFARACSRPSVEAMGKSRPVATKKNVNEINAGLNLIPKYMVQVSILYDVLFVSASLQVVLRWLPRLIMLRRQQESDPTSAKSAVGKQTSFARMEAC